MTVYISAMRTICQRKGFAIGPCEMSGSVVGKIIS